MIQTLTLNPMIGIILAALAQSFIVAMFVFVPEGFLPNNKGKIISYEIFKYFGSGVMVIFGLIFLDMAIPWLLGAWSLADWRFQLPNALILLFLGLEYVLIGVLKKGNLFDIAWFGSLVITYLVFIHWWVSLGAVMGTKMKHDLPVIAGVFIIS
ncbi:MAG: hypothetical protein ACTSVI_01330, partial [Promethearchaeota archaeon]